MSDVVIVDPGGAPGFVEVPQPVDPTIVTIAKGEKGDRGEKGDPGRDGADGQPGRDGVDGSDGAPGRDGAPGVDGRDGTDGLSAYEVAVAAGFVGTEAEWLASLVGPAGADGEDGAPGRDGVDGQPGRDGVDGLPGEKGDKGDPGADGADGAPGVGVPTGGSVGQVLTKTGASDYATGWTDVAGGGGGGGLDDASIAALVNSPSSATRGALDGMYPRLWRGTQTAYDALDAYDPMTLYVVEG